MSKLKTKRAFVFAYFAFLLPLSMQSEAARPLDEGNAASWRVSGISLDGDRTFTGMIAWSPWEYLTSKFTLVPSLGATAFLEQTSTGDKKIFPVLEGLLGVQYSLNSYFSGELSAGMQYWGRKPEDPDNDPSMYATFGLGGIFFLPSFLRPAESLLVSYSTILSHLGLSHLVKAGMGFTF